MQHIHAKNNSLLKSEISLLKQKLEHTKNLARHRAKKVGGYASRLKQSNELLKFYVDCIEKLQLNLAAARASAEENYRTSEAHYLSLLNANGELRQVKSKMEKHDIAIQAARMGSFISGVVMTLVVGVIFSAAAWVILYL